MAQRLITPPPAPMSQGLRLRAAEMNAVSIRKVPGYLLGEARKLHLMYRAGLGDDVRAWCSWEPPAYVMRWWLWDGAAWDCITRQFGVKEYLGREL